MLKCRNALKARPKHKINLATEQVLKVECGLIAQGSIATECKTRIVEPYNGKT